MKKTTNSSKIKRAPAKKLLTFQEERDARLGLRMKPIDTEYLKQLGDELLQWVTDYDTDDGKKRVTLTRFLGEKKIIDQTMQLWRKRCTYLEECWQAAKKLIGDRLEYGLVHKNFSERAAMYMLPRYLPHWKELDQYHDERKKNTDTLSAFLGKTFDIPALEGDDETTDRDTAETTTL